MLQEKYQQLQTIFKEMDRTLIAYSGGVDSALIAKVAQDVLGDRVLAITAISPSLLPEELAEAEEQAEGVRAQAGNQAPRTAAVPPAPCQGKYTPRPPGQGITGVSWHTLGEFQ